MSITEENMLAGTPQYMAPEQITGEKVNPRSDIFAFGCVFYELLTGEKAFQGDSLRTVMAAIVTTEPRPVRELKPDCPPAIQFVLDRCFQKERAQRWQSAHDLKLAIETALQEPLQRARTSMRWPIAGCIIAAGLATAFYFIGQRQHQPATRLFTMQLSADFVTPARISPDGQSIAVASEGMLTVRRLDSITAKPVKDSDDATHPFWSPDSQHIAFFSGGKLKRAAADGGPTLTVAAAPEGQGGAWWQSDPREGFIVFAPGTGGLFRVGVNGGQTTPVTERADGENRHRQPEFLPDGRLLYNVDGAPDRRGLVLASLDGSGKATNQRLLLPRARGYGYVQPGLLVFSRGELLAQRFDLQTSELLGPAFPISTKVTPEGTREAAVSISADGRTAAFTIEPQLIRDLMIVNRDGSRTTIAPSLPAVNLRVSPDSNKLALTLLNESMDVWIHDLPRDTRTRLTSHISSDGVPTWSPDGRLIAFATIRDGTANIYVTEASGEAQERALVRSQLEKYPTDWSPKGEFLLYQVANVRTGWDLHVAHLRSDLTVSADNAFLTSDFNESQGRFSPDGRYVAYSSNETGRPEIYVCTFPNGSGKTRVSRDGGWQPEWGAGGRELYFLAPDGMLMQVITNVAGTFSAGVPRKLVTTSADTTERAAQYAVAGARFFVISRPTKSIASVAVALNWRGLER